MENTENTLNQPQNESSFLKIEGESLVFLHEVRRWAKFFAILGFIAMGFLALFTIMIAAGFSVLGSMSEFGSLGGAELIIIVAVMAACIVLYYFPTMYLWKFSSHTKTALAARSDAEIRESFRYMKKYARFVGILTIVILVLYLLLIPFSIIGAAAASSM